MRSLIYAVAQYICIVLLLSYGYDISIFPPTLTGDVAVKWICFFILLVFINTSMFAYIDAKIVSARKTEYEKITRDFAQSNMNINQLISQIESDGTKEVTRNATPFGGIDLEIRDRSKKP